MNWGIVYSKEAQKDFKKLSGNQQCLVMNALKRVSKNPLLVSEGGYGKPFGNKQGKNLTGLLKIKLKSAGLRVVYKLIRTETAMVLIVIGARADEEAYDKAYIRTHGNKN